MKNKFLAIATLALFLSITSCTLEVREDNDVPKSENVFTGNTISGTITKNTTIKKGNYVLEGVVKVADGVILTIDPGAVFTAKSSVGTSLVVLKGGKIDAQGTASEPIIFTSDQGMS